MEDREKEDKGIIVGKCSTGKCKATAVE